MCFNLIWLWDHLDYMGALLDGLLSELEEAAGEGSSPAPPLVAARDFASFSPSSLFFYLLH